MSPEQASATRSLDGRSDIYALGCVLYEMLAGAPPFTGPSAQSILARHSVDPVPSLHTVRGTVPAGIEWAITKAMAKVPADRFASAGEFADALAHPEQAPVPRARDRRWLYAGLAVAVLALVFGLGGRRILGGAAGGAATGTISRGPAAGNPVRRLAVGRRHDGGPDHRSRPHQRAAGHLALGGDEVQGQHPARRRRSRGSLGVDAVLEGGLQRSGDNLRLDLRLISAASGSRLWAQRFDEPFSNRSSIGDAVSQSLVSALKLSVTSSEERQLHAPPTTNAEAYDSFLRGKIHVKQENRSEDSIAIGLFEHAVALDPSFAAAHAELAHAYGLRAFYFAAEDKEAMEKGLVAAEKALRLDPELAEGHYARGFLLWTPASHFAHEQAIQEYKRAIELNPNLDDAHRQLALVSMHIGLFEQAHEEFRKALALDPSNRIAQFQDAAGVRLGRKAMRRRYGYTARSRGTSTLRSGPGTCRGLSSNSEEIRRPRPSSRNTWMPSRRTPAAWSPVRAPSSTPRRAKPRRRRRTSRGRCRWEKASGTFTIPPTTSPRPTRCFTGPH